MPATKYTLMERLQLFWVHCEANLEDFLKCGRLESTNIVPYPCMESYYLKILKAVQLLLGFGCASQGPML